MPVKYGDTNIKNIRIGQAYVDSIYIGDELCYVDLSDRGQTVNLYNENSPWAINSSCTVSYGAKASDGGNRLTYWFKCKPNTKYTFYCITEGDKFGVFGSTTLYSVPPTTWPNGTVYRNASTPLNGNQYTFTTNATDKMIYLYLAIDVRPTGVFIYES